MKFPYKNLFLTTATIIAAASPILAQAEDIKIWAWDPNFNVAIMQEAADIYEQKHPDVNINIVDFSRESVEQKLHTMLASGITSSLPDITLIEDYSAQKYIQSYPGSFADLTGDFNFDQFAKYKSDLGEFGGKHYNIPFDSGVTGLFFRTDILEKAGFKKEDLDENCFENLKY